ncbi:MAG TPA: aminoglycoside phosphotransferase family protein [Nocardioides sp.]|nr:aminoglycoside phosphotransferase family protein [Nocardioides sp.]
MTGTSRSGPPVSQQVAHLSHRLEDTPVELFRSGGESRTFRVAGTDELITVPLTWPEVPVPPEVVQRRAALLRRVRSRVSVPVPQVVAERPLDGFLVVRQLPGSALLHLPAQERQRLGEAVAHTIGTVLRELHALDPAEFTDVVTIDEYHPEDWRGEVSDLSRDLRDVLDADQLGEVRRFLDRPAPAAAPERRLSHNDLGIEHILVAAPPTHRVTGVIDWDDAAIVDPAYDFGLLMRDLGPAALESALASYGDGTSAHGELRARAVFYAVCTLLEDLAFGHSEGRPEYVEKSMAGWRRTFETAAAEARS